MASLLARSSAVLAASSRCISSVSYGQPRQVAVRTTVAHSLSATSSALRSDLLSSRPIASSFSSVLSGTCLSPLPAPSSISPAPARGPVTVRAGGTSLGCTKRHASRKKRARVSGFRVRMSTTDGQNVLKRRRAKGRKVLVPQSSSPSGKRA